MATYRRPSAGGTHLFGGAVVLDIGSSTARTTADGHTVVWFSTEEAEKLIGDLGAAVEHARQVRPQQEV